MSCSGIVVVVPTLGKSEHFDRLFESLAGQTKTPDRIVVVVQGDESRVRRAVSRYPGLPFQIIHHSPGLSASRNHGIRMCGDDWRGALIPDDDLWLAPSTVSHASELVNGTQGEPIVFAGRVRRPGASWDRVRFRQAAQDLNRRSVWTSALEGGLLISRDAFLATGGFDETLGLGAASPFQSGEGTDLLLRLMEAGGVVRYDPRLEMYEDELVLDLPDRLRRTRAYARGTGRVYRMRYRSTGWAALVLRTALKLVIRRVRRDGEGTAVARQELIGRCEGLAGRTVARR